MQENLPLTQRFPRLTHFANLLFRNDGRGAVLIGAFIWLLVGVFIFTLTDYSLLAKIAATLVIFGFLLFFVLMPLLVVLCLFRADDC